MQDLLIMLELQQHNNSLEDVRKLPGLEEFDIDEEYGLVLISPKRQLYVIRISGNVDLDRLMSIQPAVKGVYGDPKIEPLE